MKKLYKIDRTPWSFCLVCLAVVIIALMQVPITGGTAGIASLVSGTSAAEVIGTEAEVFAVIIAVAGGGICVLYRLRQDYHILNKKTGALLYI